MWFAIDIDEIRVVIKCLTVHWPIISLYVLAMYVLVTNEA